ncbi:MAG TPA: BON domain-containing protein [Ohtaekwangia sp.]|nr:BON domain-containing protein [Ohtaekwangia sp.]
MADNNRNWGRNRTSNQDWNDNSGNESFNDDRNSNRGRYEGYGNSDWQRSGRDYGQGSTYDEGRYDRGYDYNRGGQHESSNYGDDDRSRTYGSSSYGGNFNDRGFGSRYNRERQSYSPGGYMNYGGGSGYGSNQWTGGMGGSNYGRNYGSNTGYGSAYGNSGSGISEGYGGGFGFGERSNWGDERNTGRRYGGSNYGDRRFGSSYREGRYDREFDNQGQRDERGWWDKTADEVSSWFGDEDAERRRRMDRMHKGRGPKNYQRSDERIKEDINDRLSDDWFIDASEIDVTVTNGEVTLTGTVDERSSKRRAEDIAEAVSGVRQVENRIRIDSMQTSYATTTGTSSIGTSTGTTGIGAASGKSKSSSYAADTNK